MGSCQKKIYAALKRAGRPMFLSEIMQACGITTGAFSWSSTTRAWRGSLFLMWKDGIVEREATGTRGRPHLYWLD